MRLQLEADGLRKALMLAHHWLRAADAVDRHVQIYAAGHNTRLVVAVLGDVLSLALPGYSPDACRVTVPGDVLRRVVEMTATGSIAPRRRSHVVIATDGAAGQTAELPGVSLSIQYPGARGTPTRPAASTRTRTPPGVAHLADPVDDRPQGGPSFATIAGPQFSAAVKRAGLVVGSTDSRYPLDLIRCRIAADGVQYAATDGKAVVEAIAGEHTGQWSPPFLAPAAPLAALGDIVAGAYDIGYTPRVPGVSFGRTAGGRVGLSAAGGLICAGLRFRAGKYPDPAALGDFPPSAVRQYITVPACALLAALRMACAGGAYPVTLRGSRPAGTLSVKTSPEVYETLAPPRAYGRQDIAATVAGECEYASADFQSSYLVDAVQSIPADREIELTIRGPEQPARLAIVGRADAWTIAPLAAGGKDSPPIGANLIIEQHNAKGEMTVCNGN